MLTTKPGNPRGSRLAPMIVAAPYLERPLHASEQVETWLKGIGSSAGAALTELIGDHPLIMDLLAGLSQGSPFLWRLATDDPNRLLRLLNCDPEVYLADLLSTNAAAIAAAHSDVEVMALLRRLKQEATLLIALLDIGGVWEVVSVTRALTELADHAVATALRFVLSAAAADGKLNPRDRTHPDRGSGYFVLAMGKMGAFELHFSSDIDLIVCYDPAAGVLPANVEPT